MRDAMSPARFTKSRRSASRREASLHRYLVRKTRSPAAITSAARTAALTSAAAPHRDRALGQGEQERGRSRRSAHQRERPQCPRELLAQRRDGPGQFLGGLFDDRAEQLEEGVLTAQPHELVLASGRHAGAKHRQPQVGPPGRDPGQRERGGHRRLAAGRVHEVQHDHERRLLTISGGTVGHVRDTRRCADESGSRDHGEIK